MRPIGGGSTELDNSRLPGRLAEFRLKFLKYLNKYASIIDAQRVVDLSRSNNFCAHRR